MTHHDLPAERPAEQTSFTDRWHPDQTTLDEMEYPDCPDHHDECDCDEFKDYPDHTCAHCATHHGAGLEAPEP